jgi:DNA-binding XRE family transcriptional regulator
MTTEKTKMTFKESLRAQITRLEEHVQLLERREKSLSDLRQWLEAHQLSVSDLYWMYKQMIKPNGIHDQGKPKVRNRGDADFRQLITEARHKRGWRPEQLAKKVGVSGSSVRFWESGMSVPTERNRRKIVHILGLPAKTGMNATAAMEAAQGAKI